jgi:pimeloyl-ACP methyl ester carboxylesterase
MTVRALQDEFDFFRTTHPFKILQTAFGKAEYIICGNGNETILMLHGLAGNAESVYKFILAFERDYKIICPTIPALQERTTASALAFIHLVLQHENLQPSIVIGGSFGGVLAQAYWYANSETVNKVLLFDTTPPDKAAGIKSRKAAAVIKFIPWFIFKPLFGMKLRNLFTVKAVKDEGTKNLLRFSKSRFEERFKTVSKELLLTHSNIVFDFMINTTVPAINSNRTNLLVIYSEDDPAAKGADILFKKVYPFADIVSFKGAGHIGALLYFDAYIADMNKVLNRQHFV